MAVGVIMEIKIKYTKHILPVGVRNYPTIDQRVNGYLATDYGPFAATHPPGTTHPSVASYRSANEYLTFGNQTFGTNIYLSFGDQLPPSAVTVFSV